MFCLELHHNYLIDHLEEDEAFNINIIMTDNFSGIEKETRAFFRKNTDNSGPPVL